MTRLAVVVPLVAMTVALLAVAWAAGPASGVADATERVRIDVGIVASDPERAVAFYTEAIGFRELGGFSLSGRRARRMGLSRGEPLEIRVLAFDESPSSTRLKIIRAPRASRSRAQDPTVPAHLGLRYVTVFVPDWQRAVQRLERAGMRVPEDVEIGRGSASEVSAAIVRDPDGNVVELVGPKQDGSDETGE